MNERVSGEGFICITKMENLSLIFHRETQHRRLFVYIRCYACKRVVSVSNYSNPVELHSRVVRNQSFA